MFGNSVKLFTLNGFDIKVDPSWLLIAALVTWSLSQHYFPEAMPGMSRAVYLVTAVFAMLGLFASLLMHELAHSVVARQLGVPIKSITLFLFGGVAELEGEPGSARTEFWIAVAGPAMSIALSAGFWVVGSIASWASAAAELVAILSYLAMINLVLALFNLLPAFPLDGGRVLRAVLWAQSGDVVAATRKAARSGVVLAYVLMALGVMSMFQGFVASGLWQIMIGGFVLLAARASYIQQLAKVAFVHRTVGMLMTRDPVTVSPDITVSDFVNDVVLNKRLTFAPVVEDGVLLGYVDLSLVTGIDRENWSSTRVGDVFVGMNADIMVPPDTPVQDVFATISETGRRKFLVVSDHQLLGVITLSDLTDFLQRADPMAQPLAR
ncbi:site-2 protease family protein [Aestuariivita boseongensis]|uniref:site-2 protease family protein n=1 Tax=Aestuariivita boseongensis TaxID=1470562 RepID=UPI000681242C|nr:site-2 protease family protein [Aestuariivita boseongensis]